MCIPFTKHRIGLSFFFPTSAPPSPSEWMSELGCASGYQLAEDPESALNEGKRIFREKEQGKL